MTAFGLKAMFRWTLGANRDARPGLPSALSIMGVLVELQLSTANTCRGGRLVFRTGSGSLTFGLPILPVLAVPVGAFWATGLPGYRRLPTISAEARLYELEAVFGGACATSFLSFFCGEAYALRLLGCFRLGRRWFRGFRGASGLRFWLCRLLGLAFGLGLELIKSVRGHRELEFPLKGCTYCPLVRGNQEEHQANSHVQGLSLRTRVHVMTIGRTNESINKAEDAGRIDAQIRSTDALQRVFPTTAGQPRLSWLDPPGGLVPSEFSSICFEAMRRQE